jgi:hypothetical protein
VPRVRQDPRGWTYLVLLAVGVVVAVSGLGLAHAYDQPTKLTPDVLDCARYTAILGHVPPDCDYLADR